MKKIILTGIIILIASVGLWAGFVLNNRPSLQAKPLEERIIESITREYPSFGSDEEPVIGIASMSQHGKWYIVTIKSLRSVENFVPVKIVLLDDNGWLRVVAGPEVHFPESKMLSLNLPDSVILELKKS